MRFDHEARTLYTFLSSFSHVYAVPYVSFFLLDNVVLLWHSQKITCIVSI